MANNTLAAQKPKFSMAIKSDTYQNLIKQTLGNPKKAERYTAAIMSAVATNPQLQNCEAKTILSGSLLAESLNLAHSPQLGQYYLVPFKVKAKNGIPEHYDATFILGYKGYLQLAIRSGNYKHINVMEIKEGELVSYNPFDEEIVFNPIQDVDEREKTPTIGYYAMFEYVNGFKKVLYWSKAQMLAHADKYSPAFNKASYEKLLNGEIPDRDLWKYSSFWYKDFDSMAKKTMLRQLISKWGVMSTEMIQVLDTDNNVIKIDKSGFSAELPEGENPFDTPEVPDVEPEPEAEEVNFDEL
ncbi:MAG: recombinase RecT [Oscillospiraceae bacterium]|nr:recombinase RecT [Oscillospiraceae bacterium]